MSMLTPRRRHRRPTSPASTPATGRDSRSAGASLVPPVLALGAALALAVTPVAAAQSTAEADGTIAVGSLGSTIAAAGSTSGSLGPLGSLAAPAYADYVALGDSFAALGDNTEPAAGPADCARSLANHPNVLDANPAVGDLTDATCGGARVPDVLTETQVEGAPPQVEALETGTDLVTLSIGGNDVGFGAIVACITRQGPFESLPGEATCESQIGDTVAADIASVYAEDGPVDTVYDTIAGISPDATVIATQYMPLMPAEGTTCAFTDQLNPADVAWARQVTDDINRSVDEAATRNGHVSVMPTDDVDRSACAEPGQRWTSFLGEPDDTAPMHPTALGQEAMAAAIAAAL